ncbi:hypothetical protein CDAR_366661 [Caerostris darwini]|uniref:Secreted protein n=1 Tax=Caerostris darwini TaxID=1538125 RepID=A0AAV4Q2A5_9ARAC|nr:hypothetical protein CDAR_366661 [Caerostris darwini]
MSNNYIGWLMVMSWRSCRSATAWTKNARLFSYQKKTTKKTFSQYHSAPVWLHLQRDKSCLNRSRNAKPFISAEKLRKGQTGRDFFCELRVDASLAPVCLSFFPEDRTHKGGTTFYPVGPKS